jgi:two-component system LytT family sensor kinase
MKALQAQINPHFLFNALNTISSFLRTDPSRARELIVSLSTYLRYNIDQLEALVDITKELEQVQAYVEIERARHGDELNVVYNIDDNLRIRLPSLIIQPLVENAIKHGILEGSGAGTVMIDIRRLNSTKVRVAVEDDGIGIPDSVIESIQSGGHSSRVGLSNVNSRLMLVYHRGLAIERLARGTRVEFILDELAG